MEKKSIEDMTAEELKKELEHVKECLIDEEDTYGFSMHKASVHIGSGQVEAMKDDFEYNCRNYKEKISKIEKLLKKNS